jgi:hypothetical protein
MTHLALSAHRAIQVEQCSRQVAVKPACRKLTPNIHSSHNLNRPEAKRFRVKLANLKIPKIYLVKIFLDLLEAENFKSKDLANEHPVFMPANTGLRRVVWRRHGRIPLRGSTPLGTIQLRFGSEVGVAHRVLRGFSELSGPASSGLADSRTTTSLGSSSRGILRRSMPQPTDREKRLIWGPCCALARSQFVAAWEEEQLQNALKDSSANAAHRLEYREGSQ